MDDKYKVEELVERCTERHSLLSGESPILYNAPFRVCELDYSWIQDNLNHMKSSLSKAILY